MIGETDNAAVDTIRRHHGIGLPALAHGNLKKNHNKQSYFIKLASLIVIIVLIDA